MASGAPAPESHRFRGSQASGSPVSWLSRRFRGQRRCWGRCQGLLAKPGLLPDFVVLREHRS
eukprot:11214148-Lingulodinium_polyedra.AAC.1